jgi:hypothetical protein
MRPPKGTVPDLNFFLRAARSRSPRVLAMFCDYDDLRDELFEVDTYSIVLSYFSWFPWQATDRQSPKKRLGARG